MSTNVSLHAKEMWATRVDPASDLDAAREAIREMLAKGVWSGRPKKWTLYKERAGVQYVSWHERPGVVLVVDRDSVVTTVTRSDPHTKRRLDVAKARRSYQNQRMSRPRHHG